MEERYTYELKDRLRALEEAERKLCRILGYLDQVKEGDDILRAKLADELLELIG